MKPLDKEALERALTLALQDPQRRAQIESKLEDEPREEVMQFAAYDRQIRDLGLKPWEPPPCHADFADTENPHIAKANALARRLIDSGLSIYEPEITKHFIVSP